MMSPLHSDLVYLSVYGAVLYHRGVLYLSLSVMSGISVWVQGRKHRLQCVYLYGIEEVQAYGWLLNGHGTNVPELCGGHWALGVCRKQCSDAE